MLHNSNSLQKILNQRKYVLELLIGKDEHDNDGYAYVLFNKQLFEEKKEDFAKEYVDIEKYGIVVLRGNGKPSEESNLKAQAIFQEKYAK